MKRFSKALSIILSAALALAFVQIGTLYTPQEADAASPEPTVTVKRAATGKLTLMKGAKYKLAATTTAGKLSYESSKPKVVSVTKKGVLKAKKVGKATIAVTATSGKKKATKKVKVTVVAKKKFKKVKKLAATAGATKLQVGKTTKVKVSVTPKKASNKNATYKSSNPAVLAIDAYGKVTAKKAGSAKVTVTSCDNAKAKASVTFTVVKPRSGGTSPTPAKATLKNLYASPQHFVEGSEDAVSLFTVEASNASAVNLAAGECTFAMNDKGADGDETAGDGIWSATVDFTDLAAGESVECRATAGDGIQTDPLTVAAFPAWSEGLEEQAKDQTQELGEAIYTAVVPYVDSNTGYIENEEDFDAALANLELALKALVEDGTAISYEMSSEGGSVKLATGPRCVYSLPIEGMQSSGIDVRVEYWCPSIIVKDPAEGMYPNKRLDDDEITCRTVIEQMPKNSVIWWNGHGSYYQSFGSTLNLTEKYWHAIKDLGWDDAVADRVGMRVPTSITGLALPPQGEELTGTVILDAGFFDKYKPNMSGDIFVAAVCCGAEDGRLGYALKRCGCKGYFGYTDKVDYRYNCPFSSDLVKELMKGETLGAAFKTSALANGVNQYDFFMNRFDAFRVLAYLDEQNRCKPTVLYGGDYSLGNPSPTVPDVDVQDCSVVSLGGKHSAAITSDNSLWMWGWDGYGQLGDGGTINYNEFNATPARIMDDVAYVSLGWYHSAAIKTDGSLWTWGLNADGQLGDGTTTSHSEPVHIMDDVAYVCMGYQHSAAITTDGSLYMWGSNSWGALGDSSLPSRTTTPTKIMDNVVAVSLSGGSSYSAAIKADGTLWTWGRNNNGQLGDGTDEDRDAPAKIMDDVASVALGGYHSAAIKSDGSLWMWGSNDFGQVGDGSNENRMAPVQVMMDGVAMVSLGSNHSAALKTDGSLWVWGQNGGTYYEEGMLGNGTTEDSNTPIHLMEGVIAISMGNYHSSALMPDGSLLAWGYNSDGCVGDGTTDNHLSPVTVMEDVKVE